MGFETLKNILDFNKEQAALYTQDEDLENNICPHDAWPLNIDSQNNKSCPICGQVWRG